MAPVRRSMIATLAALVALACQERVEDVDVEAEGFEEIDVERMDPEQAQRGGQIEAVRQLSFSAAPERTVYDPPPDLTLRPDQRRQQQRDTLRVPAATASDTAQPGTPGAAPPGATAPGTAPPDTARPTPPDTTPPDTTMAAH